MSKDSELIERIKSALLIKNEDGRYARSPIKVSEDVGVTKASVHNSRKNGKNTHDLLSSLKDVHEILLKNEKEIYNEHV